MRDLCDGQDDAVQVRTQLDQLAPQLSLLQRFPRVGQMAGRFGQLLRRLRMPGLNVAIPFSEQRRQILLRAGRRLFRGVRTRRTIVLSGGTLHCFTRAVSRVLYRRPASVALQVAVDDDEMIHCCCVDRQSRSAHRSQQVPLQCQSEHGAVRRPRVLR